MKWNGTDEGRVWPLPSLPSSSDNYGQTLVNRAYEWTRILQKIYKDISLTTVTQDYWLAWEQPAVTVLFISGCINWWSQPLQQKKDERESRILHTINHSFILGSPRPASPSSASRSTHHFLCFPGLVVSSLLRAVTTLPTSPHPIIRNSLDREEEDVMGCGDGARRSTFVTCLFVSGPSPEPRAAHPSSSETVVRRALTSLSLSSWAPRGRLVR